jgi:cytidine deaminase
MTADPLFVRAAAARGKAYAPYSNFKVGAAIEAADGTIYSGCNVENASYGMTVCAERVAVMKGISEGAQRFNRVAIIADTEELTPPCGACRQVLWELCGNIEVYLVNLKKQMLCYMLADLMPLPFDSHLIGKAPPPSK